jgi:hypothetical protein
VCYKALLPFSRYAKDFWTVSGILSAANRGRKELEMYLDCKRWPHQCSVLELAVSAGLERDKMQEVRTILGLEFARSLLDLDEIFHTAALLGNLDILDELIQLGADLGPLEPSRYDVLLEHAVESGVNKGLKVLLESDLFTLEEIFAENVKLVYILANIHPAADTHKYLENLEFLVEQGLDLNTPIFQQGFDK